MNKNLNDISKHVKKKRKQNKLTQPELAAKAGVGLRFVRDLEQGKNTMRIDKVNDVLRLFGETLGVVAIDRQKLIENEST
jgi:y4mF family transcriptional regulator